MIARRAEPSPMASPTAATAGWRPIVAVRRAGQRRVRSVAGADARWDALLVCVSAYLLTAVGRVHQLFPAVAIVRPAILFGLLAVGLYLLNQQDERRSKYVFVSTTKLLALFLFWMVLSVPGALVIGHSFDVVFNGFLKTFLMFVVMVGAVRGVRDVERLAVTYLVGVTVYAVSILMQVDLDGEWRLGDLFYYDANDFAVLAVTAMPLALYFLQSRRAASARLLALVALVALIVGFVRSGSRGGFLALLVVAAFILFRYSSIPLRHRVGATALAAFIVIGIASGQYWAQMNTIFSDADYNWTSETGRTQIWSRGLGYMIRYPVFGVGPGNFQAAEGTLSEFAERQQRGVGVRWNAAHNSYLQVGAELGVPGLVCFLAILRAAFAALRRPRRHADARIHAAQGLKQALMASLIGFVVGAFFLSLAYHEMLYTLIALAVGLQKVTGLRLQHA